MQRGQLRSVTKDELIESIISAGEQDVGVTAVLEERLTTIATEINELRRAISSSEVDVNKKLEDMQVKIDKQAEIIVHQQRFLEALDRKERECNLIVLGVPDDGLALDGATCDGEKLEKIWATIDEETEMCSHRRLGRPSQDSTKKRPILVTVTSKSSRDGVLEKAKRLKESGPHLNKIYIKKDVHPSVRKEWSRLRSVEAAEKERPENAGCVIRLDVKERKLYRDGVVIDRWNPQYF